MGAHHHCRACGYRSDTPPWGSSGQEPTFDYCPCCGVEWGYQDALPDGARAFRATWLAAGAPWSDEDFERDGLTAQERLRHVPPGFE